jgi:tryptophan 7-halogenase
MGALGMGEGTFPTTLADRLERWRFRAPSSLDVDLNRDLFTGHSWQHVLYWMGFRTDLAARAPMFRYRAEAAAAFAGLRRDREVACRKLPPHRDLLRAAGMAA